MTRKQKRLNELTALDYKVMEAIRKCCWNLAALHNLKLQEEAALEELKATRKLYEVELLELKSEKGYVNDVNAEEGKNLVF